MIIDHLLQVSNAQAVTASAGSTNLIDFGQVNPNSGNAAQPTAMVFTVDTTATAAGAATCAFSVQDCDTEGGTYVDVAVSAPIPKASLVAGAQFVIPMPTKHRRYVKAAYTVATGPLTAGAFSAQVVAGYQQNQAYPDSPKIA